jgi:VCBS repeat-containing protein
MWANWIRTLIAFPRCRPTRRSVSTVGGRPRPRFDTLEDRTVPAAFRLGSTAADTATSVATDSTGNLFASGTFNGTVDFDPGAGVTNLTSTGNADGYLAKYDPLGSLAWVGQIVDGSVNKLAVGADGAVFATGTFTGTTDFDFGPGVTTLTAAPFGSAFVAKYASGGGLVWAKKLGGTDASTSGDAITLDASGNVYSSGVLSNGSADMDPGPGTFTLTNVSGNANSFIEKLDSAGNFVWAKQFENDPSIAAGVWTAGLGVDAAQDVYVTGVFVGRVDFDTSGTTTYTSTFDTTFPSGDGYAAKLTAAGDLAYVVRIGSATGREDGNGIAVDTAGNAYVTGEFTGATTIDATAGDTTLTSAGNDDVFVLRLNPTGGLDWARRIGSTGNDGGQAIAFDGADNLYISGYYANTVDFDPNAGVTNLTFAGGFTDVFALRLKTDSTFVNAWSLGGTDYEFGNAVAVTGSGTVAVVGRFRGTADFDPGPGTLNLTSAGDDDAFVATIAQVTPNRPPVAVDDAYATDEDTALPIAAPGVLANDTDPDGNPLTAALVAGPAHGTLTFNADGSFTYRPARNYNGPDSFTYKANDGSLDSNVATVTITVRPVNDPPFPSPVVQNVTTPEDTALPGQVHGTDVDGDPLTFALVQGPTHGTLVFNADGTFTYTPAANYNGPDAFVFKVSDPSGASNNGGVSITVTPVNDAPTAVPDAYTMDEDGTLTVTASPVTRLRMVSEPGDFVGQGLTYDFTPATAAFSGSQNFDNGASLSVDPPAPGDFWFLDFAAANNAPLTPGAYPNAMRFPFQDPGHPGFDVSGNGRGSNTLTGQFTVYDAAFSGSTLTRFAAAFEQHSEGNAPALVGWVMFNSTFGAGGGVLANDTDVEGDLLLGATLVNGPAHGTLAFNGDGTFSYSPNPNFNGTDTFSYRTNDGRADSNVATVTITVRPVNDPPVATDGSAATDEDTPVNGSVTATDVDGDPLTYSVVSGPAHGVLTGFDPATGAFTYAPDPNYNGSDSLTFKANDGTVDSNTATFALTVRPVNDAPVAADANGTTPEDTPLSGTVTATDIDGDSLTYSLVAGPAHGTVTLNADGTFSYSPAANYNGSDSFTFKANDGTVDSNVATVSITVTPVNDPPTANPASATTAEDTPLSGTVTATDVDGDPLAYSLVAGPAHGIITLAASGAYTYTPAADFNGTDSFTFKANDGTVDSNVATVSITVTPVDDAPVAGAGTLTTAEDTPATGAVTSTDVDGPAPTYSVVAGPAHGALTAFDSTTGAFTYTPSANYNGSDSFTFKANDGTLDSNVATVSITVTPVNDPPVAADGSLSTPANVPANGSVVATDVDGDPLTYSVVDGPAHGTLTAFDNSTGVFIYTPAAGYGGPDSFTFKANDGTVDSNTATVSITVTANNHPPVARNDSAVTREDTPVAVAVLANDSDPDGDTLTVSAVTRPAHGTAVINPDGTVTYTPAANFHGTDSFTYTADDGHGGTATATVALTVRSVNDPPVANDASFSIDEDTVLRDRVTATDPDGNPLTYRRVTGPAHGTLTLNANGTFVYRPAADYNGRDSFTFKATDGTLGSNVATVTITVRPVNDPPDANNDSYTTTAGDELTVPAAGVLANDTDVDGDTLTAVLAAGPAHGRLTLNADGSFLYMPAAGFAGADSFTYRANDGTVSGNLATVTIRVKAAATTSGQATGGGFVDGGARHFDLNVRSQARPGGGFTLAGNVAFRDTANDVTLDSTTIQSFRVDAGGTRAVITGSATVNGRAGYTFTVIVEDLGEPGVGHDTFRIQITGPHGYDYDSLDYAGNLGILDGGNIQVRQRP